MNDIFAPLDASESLPRELLMESRRQRNVGRWELAGAMWLPTLLLILVLGGWLNLTAGPMVLAVVMSFVAFLLFALRGRRPR